ncbi:MAG: BrnT family toxin [Bacteroidales bacterium]|nr:BrnT family toxin [Bacteroidales bacterium]
MVHYKCMTFEWDEQKNTENKQKHNISFNDAQYAFFDKNRVIIQDDKHSQTEDRFFCIGQLENCGIVTVRFTIRNNNIRIFGAGFWRQGRKKYEETNNLH